MAAKKYFIVYFCDGTCQPDVRKKRMKKGSTVFLIADGTRVKLKFEASPFVSGNTTISIAAGKFVKEQLLNVKQTFEYKLTCGSCPSPSDDPSMILEV